ncbi:MAG: hypothetical protein PHE68_04585 [Candidatus Peribacteraceae bacterium]|nr:hypothetical protein [Candidatus Peribacteraceae bacterium]MDD5074871.1 hypothetical protein [Candidatus Peribacteraceae bacterium]
MQQCFALSASLLQLIHVPTRRRNGYLLLEALIATGVFALFMGAISFALFYGQEGALKTGDRIRGVFLSEEALGAVRAIRDKGFADLLPGQHGTCIGADGAWGFCGSESVTTDGYTTRLTLESLAADHVRATAETRWNFGMTRTGSVILTDEFTDWRVVKPIGNWARPVMRGSFVDDTVPLFNAVAVAGDYAFVTSENGAGLYVFDLTDPAHPARVAEGLSLGAAGYKLAVDGTTLYVCTAANGEEVQIFDISGPSSLSMDKRIATIDVPGDGRSRSIAIFGRTLFVGATESGTASEFYAYDVSNPYSVRLLGSLEDTGSYFDISLHDGYAYVADSDDSLELRVIDVFDPENLAFASGGGFNLTDVQDALTVAAVGDKVLVGRRNGDVIEELVLLDISRGPVPFSPPGPWYQEVAANANGIVAEPGERFAFLASDNLSSELQVIDLQAFALGQPPVIAVSHPDKGGGRGITYDPLHDRVLLATDKALLLYVPTP